MQKLSKKFTRVVAFLMLLSLMCSTFAPPLTVEATDITDWETGDVIEHTCANYLKTVYDTDQHWKECTICAAKFEIHAHEYTFSGNYECNKPGRPTYTCDCGYSYYDEYTHRLGEYINAPRGIHFRVCSDCGGWYDQEECRDVYGNNIGCDSMSGTCAKCHYVYDINHHDFFHTDDSTYERVSSSKGVFTANVECYQCGLEVGKVYAEVTGSGSICSADIRITITDGNFSSSDAATGSHVVDTCEPSNTGIANTLDHGWTQIGNAIYCKYTADFSGMESYVCEIHYPSNAHYNGRTSLEGFHLGILSPTEWTAPTVGVSSRDIHKNGEWSTLREFTVSGTEMNALETAVELWDGDTCVYQGAAQASGTYSTTFTPKIEADETGRPFTFKVSDRSGNVTEKIINVAYLDSVPPSHSTPESPFTTEWSQSKTYSWCAVDRGSGNVKFSFNDPENFVSMQKSGVNYFLPNYSVTCSEGTVIGPEGKKLAIYFKDAVDNVLTDYVWVYNLDNQKPTVRIKSKSEPDVKVTVSLEGNDGVGSGIASYGVSKSANELPASWSTSNDMDISESGTYWFFTKDNVGLVSEPVKEVITVSYDLTFNYNKPLTASNVLANNSVTSKKVNYSKPIGELPNPTLRGWTFTEWRVDSSSVVSSSIYAWRANKTAIASWKENTYSVRYNDTFGNSVIQPNIPYESETTPYTTAETGFTREGYYIDGWAKTPGSKTPVYYLPLDKAIDPNRTTIDKFQRLSDKDGATIDLYAVWKPIPYVIRIWDNYNGTDAPYKDFTAHFDAEFTLPSALWEHENAYVMGYDFNKKTFVDPAYRVHDKLTNLTVKPGEVINIYTIWDNVPSIKSPNEINFNYEIARANGIQIVDNTISMTQLEAYLLAQVISVTDYEWTARVGSDGRPGNIPIGESYGYSVRILSFNANTVEDAATGETPLSYTVTYAVTDDAGNSATSVTKLFLGDLVNILTLTY